MKAKEFWQIFVADMEPGAFMCMFPSQDPKACVHQYLQRRPAIFGIVRLESWKHTFQEPVQYTRESVEAALISYLEETRPEWEEAVAEHARELERQAAIEATQRALAEKARQEAEAMERARQVAEAAEKAAQEADAAEASALETAPPVPETSPEAFGEAVNDAGDDSASTVPAADTAEPVAAPADEEVAPPEPPNPEPSASPVSREFPHEPEQATP